MAGPHRVVELRTVMNGRVDAETAVVDGVAVEDRGEKVVRDADTVVRLVDFGVGAARFVVARHEDSGQLEGVLRVVDVAPLSERLRFRRGHAAAVEKGGSSFGDELSHVLE